MNMLFFELYNAKAILIGFWDAGFYAVSRSL